VLDTASGWTVAGRATMTRSSVSCNGAPRPLAGEAQRRGGRGESSTVWTTPWPLDAWPDVPTKVILCKEDHVFPAAFMRRLAQQRLGTAPDEITGGHCAALSHPKELSDLLAGHLD
jgi:pimeloyl-ACP methyl ester carboxylesterase